MTREEFTKIYNERMKEVEKEITEIEELEKEITKIKELEKRKSNKDKHKGGKRNG